MTDCGEVCEQPDVIDSGEGRRAFRRDSQWKGEGTGVTDSEEERDLG